MHIHVHIYMISENNHKILAETRQQLFTTPITIVFICLISARLYNTSTTKKRNQKKTANTNCYQHQTVAC